MIKHFVLLQIADHIKTNEIEKMVNKLVELKNTSIPQIKKISYGKSCSIEGLERGFNYAFVMEFENVSERDIYINHADHKKVSAEYILPILKNGIESVIVFDF
jgi:hypothetical protein